MKYFMKEMWREIKIHVLESAIEREYNISLQVVEAILLVK